MVWCTYTSTEAESKTQTNPITFWFANGNNVAIFLMEKCFCVCVRIFSLNLNTQQRNLKKKKTCESWYMEVLNRKKCHKFIVYTFSGKCSNRKIKEKYLRGKRNKRDVKKMNIWLMKISEIMQKKRWGKKKNTNNENVFLLVKVYMFSCIMFSFLEFFTNFVFQGKNFNLFFIFEGWTFK